jgi:hypothetical protein
LRTLPNVAELIRRAVETGDADRAEALIRPLEADVVGRLDPPRLPRANEHTATSTTVIV